MPSDLHCGRKTAKRPLGGAALGYPGDIRDRSVEMLRTLMAAVLISCSAATAGTERNADGMPVIVEKMASKLDVPWSVAFLPGCEFLITQRGGELLHFGSSGVRTEVGGVPKVRADGQGGLLDVAATGNFEQSREILLSYAKPQGRRAGTALTIAALSPDSSQLINPTEIFEMAPGSSGGRHFGSRIAEAPDGTIFLTIGERGDQQSAQELSNHNGTIIRIRRDGSVPIDNPFVDQSDAQPEIWSYGHRNPQGATFDAEGRLWINEHGARGGDEINLARKGANHGWPVISYGVHYTGRKIGLGTEREGMEQPAFYWDPSIAPSGMAIYSGRLWPEWKGHFFIGSLKSDFISRVGPEGGFRELERIRFPETKRVRDVREAPDGTIWFLSEDRGAAYRISPTGFEPECSPRSR